MFTVRAVTHGAYRFRMSFQRAEAHTRRCIPDFYRFIVGAAGNIFTVGTIRNGVHTAWCTRTKHNLRRGRTFGTLLCARFNAAAFRLGMGSRERKSSQNGGNQLFVFHKIS